MPLYSENTGLRFTKMHGLGNDFIVLDGVSQPLLVDAAKVRTLADRKSGVGCDQLLLLEPPTVPDADFFYRIFNADGQEVEQCGNGARCIMAFVHHYQLSPKSTLTLQTIAGRLKVRMLKSGCVEAYMPKPEFTPAKIPLLSDLPGPAHKISLADDQQVSFVALSLGNPHAVIFVEDVENCQMNQIVPALQATTCFPEGVNASFCQIVNQGLVRLRVHERGVGETQACGSGACATVAAGCELGKLEQNVRVSLSGGDLDICYRGATEPIKMTGPATIVFDGTLAE